ncbi:hypothetical protein ISN44_As05g026220 [Arabidopsis suecica]|uniref:Uncharacterized protein n=1 Tax=Arabidopsis suecica TaxID=45249 RepID=A0A8T2DTG3_ARASU|nr:hypothetical protein ISN44_As05g026220 [Arabidopsis suecica]
MSIHHWKCSTGALRMSGTRRLNKEVVLLTSR